MSDLDPDSDDERFVYMVGDANLRNIDISQQVEFRKDARADQNGSWGKGIRDENQVTVTEGGKYTYRLTVASRQDSLTTGILVYDAIEEYVPHEGYDQDDVNGKKAWKGDWQGKGQWKGRLESVDLSELYADMCGARLYYSTKAGLVFDNNIDTSQRGWANFSKPAWSSAYRLTDDTIWKEVTGSLVDGVWTVPEELLGKVTAIAVDAQHYNRRTTAMTAHGTRRVPTTTRRTTPRPRMISTGPARRTPPTTCMPTMTRRWYSSRIPLRPPGCPTAKPSPDRG